MNVPKFFISRLVFRNSQKQKICFVFKRKVSHFRGISRNSRKSKWTRASSQNARYLCLWEGWETGINQKALKPFECTFGSLEGLEGLSFWFRYIFEQQVILVDRLAFGPFEYAQQKIHFRFVSNSNHLFLVNLLRQPCVEPEVIERQVHSKCLTCQMLFGAWKTSVKRF